MPGLSKAVALFGDLSIGQLQTGEGAGWGARGQHRFWEKGVLFNMLLLSYRRMWRNRREKRCG